MMKLFVQLSTVLIVESRLLLKGAFDAFDPVVSFGQDTDNELDYQEYFKKKEDEFQECMRSPIAIEKEEEPIILQGRDAKLVEKLKQDEKGFFEKVSNDFFEGLTGYAESEFRRLGNKNLDDLNVLMELTKSDTLTIFAEKLKMDTVQKWLNCKNKWALSFNLKDDYTFTAGQNATARFLTGGLDEETLGFYATWETLFAEVILGHTDPLAAVPANQSAIEIGKHVAHLPSIVNGVFSHWDNIAHLFGPHSAFHDAKAMMTGVVTSAVTFQQLVAQAGQTVLDDADSIRNAVKEKALDFARSDTTDSEELLKELDRFNIKNMMSKIEEDLESICNSVKEQAQHIDFHTVKEEAHNIYDAISEYVKTFTKQLLIDVEQGVGALVSAEVVLMIAAPIKLAARNMLKEKIEKVMKKFLNIGEEGEIAQFAADVVTDGFLGNIASQLSAKAATAASTFAKAKADSVLPGSITGAHSTTAAATGAHSTTVAAAKTGVVAKSALLAKTGTAVAAKTVAVGSAAATGAATGAVISTALVHTFVIAVPFIVVKRIGQFHLTRNFCKSQEDKEKWYCKLFANQELMNNDEQLRKLKAEILKAQKRHVYDPSANTYMKDEDVPNGEPQIHSFLPTL